MLVYAEYNNTMQYVAGTRYKSSDHHVESTNARKGKRQQGHSNTY
jgi:hypothetical protein